MSDYALIRAVAFTNRDIHLNNIQHPETLRMCGGHLVIQTLTEIRLDD